MGHNKWMGECLARITARTIVVPQDQILPKQKISNHQ